MSQSVLEGLPESPCVSVKPEGLNAKRVLDILGEMRARTVEVCRDYQGEPITVESMKHMLAACEEALPLLLSPEQEPEWQDMKLVDEATVFRLHRKIGKYRLCLHKIEPCEEGDSIYHYHPGPISVHVIEGDYEMGIGHGSGPEAPPITCTMNIPEGFTYEMPHKDGWHYVRLRNGKPSWSVMLLGELWKKPAPLDAKGVSFEKMSDDERRMIFERFRLFYPSKEGL